MMKKRAPAVENSFKLNLIPIMDAVFIFIFFLLFSAQFIKIFEHGGDVPVVSEAPPVEDNKKEPLNLKVKIDKLKVIISTGLDDKEYRRFDIAGNDEDYKVLNNAFIEIKNTMASKDDDYVIIIPTSKTKYEVIVKLMDSVRFVPEPMLASLPAEKFVDGKVFSKVVLEPIE